MGFERWDYKLLGCWESPDFLQSRPGVVVLWVGESAPETVIYVAESEDCLRSATGISEQLQKKASKKLWYSVIYTGEIGLEGRTQIRDRIRSKEKLRDVMPEL